MSEQEKAEEVGKKAEALAKQLANFMKDLPPREQATACLVLAGQIIGQQMAQREHHMALAGYLFGVQLFTSQVALELNEVQHPTTDNLIQLLLSVEKALHS